MTRTISMGVAIRIGDVEIVPIESAYISGHVIGPALAVVAAKEPVAVIVRTRDGERVVDLEGREVRLGELLRHLPPGAAAGAI